MKKFIALLIVLFMAGLTDAGMIETRQYNDFGNKVALFTITVGSAAATVSGTTSYCTIQIPYYPDMRELRLYHKQTAYDVFYSTWEFKYVNIQAVDHVLAATQGVLYPVEANMESPFLINPCSSYYLVLSTAGATSGKLADTIWGMIRYKSTNP